MTLLDEQTREQLHNLANVVASYTTADEETTPERLSWEPYRPDYTTPRGQRQREKYRLTRAQQDRACYLRRMYRWHSRTIAEALGLAKPPYTRYYEANVTDALEECSQRDTWNNQKWRLRPDEIHWKGPHEYGEARTSLMREAIALLLISDPTMPSKETHGAAKRLVDRWKAQGAITGDVPLEYNYQDVNRVIRDLEAVGFVWEGAGRTQRMYAMPEEMRAKVDAEIIRRCTEDIEKQIMVPLGLGRPDREVAINYSQIARDVSNDFEVEPGLTIKALGFPDVLPLYVRELCISKGVTPQYIREWVGKVSHDPENIKKIKDIMDKSPRISVANLSKQTGLNVCVVRAIQDILGVRRTLNIRGTAEEYDQYLEQVLQANKDGLTLAETIEKYPDVLEYWGGVFAKAREGIRHTLNQRKLPIHTEATQAATRRLPLVAENIKLGVEQYLRQESIQNDSLYGSTNPPYYIRLATIDSLATMMKETPEMIRNAVNRLVNTAERFIILRDDEIQIPPQTQNRVLREETRTLTFLD